MSENWFADRFEKSGDRYFITPDNEIKCKGGENALKDYLRASFKKTSYENKKYEKVDELCAGLAKHPRAQEERLTQIFTWILQQKCDDFKDFRRWFLGCISKSLVDTELDFIAEQQTGKLVAGKSKEIDIVAFAANTNKETKKIAIECKIDAPFQVDQLKNYAEWLKCGQLVVIVKHFANFESDYYKEQLKEYPNVRLCPIYWCEIFSEWNRIMSGDIKEDIKNVFKLFNLDTNEYKEPFYEGRRKNIIDGIRDFINDPKNKKPEEILKENRTILKTKNPKKVSGFCNFSIYKDNKCKLKERAQYIRAIPSLNIEIGGILIRHRAEKSKEASPLLSVTAKVFYEKGNSYNAEKICKKLENSHNWEERSGEYLVCKKIELKSGEDIENYMKDTVRPFIDKVFKEWEDANKIL